MWNALLWLQCASEWPHSKHHDGYLSSTRGHLKLYMHQSQQALRECIAFSNVLERIGLGNTTEDACSSADMVVSRLNEVPAASSNLLRYHVTPCQCGCIFCLEPEDCMCTPSQCTTMCQLSHQEETMSVSNTTAEAAEQEFTLNSNLMYPFSHHAEESHRSPRP